MTAIERGDDCAIDASVTLGYGQFDRPTAIGDDAVIRSGTIIYGDVTIGDRFRTGHRALVREGTTVGDDVLVGTDAIVDGQSTIGSRVSIQSGVYIPTNTAIGDDVFLGPGAVLTNDAYPIRSEAPLTGPTLEDGVSVGANATLLPDVTVGSHAFVAAAAVVTDDVPPQSLAVGAPATVEPLPPALSPPNQIE